MSDATDDTTAAPVRERAWPLSAAASAVLLDPGRTTPKEVVTLSLKELVGRGCWRARTQKPQGRRGAPSVVLRPGPRPERPLPSPLGLLEAGLRPIRLDRAGELPMGNVGKGLRDQQGKAWAQGLLDVARGDLMRAGLLERKPRRLRADLWTRTTSGDSWAAEVTRRRDALKHDLPRLVADDMASAAELLARAGWLLLLVPEAGEHLPALREWLAAHPPETRPRRETGAGELAYSAQYTVWTADEGIPNDLELLGGGLADLGSVMDLSGLDTLNGLDAAFDSGLDSAFSSGDLGGGFDGGGFDGGGGGGDGGGGGGN